jgi:hypothetical protein
MQLLVFILYGYLHSQSTNFFFSHKIQKSDLCTHLQYRIEMATYSFEETVSLSDNYDKNRLHISWNWWFFYMYPGVRLLALMMILEVPSTGVSLDSNSLEKSHQSSRKAWLNWSQIKTLVSLVPRMIISADIWLDCSSVESVYTVRVPPCKTGQDEAISKGDYVRRKYFCIGNIIKWRYN